MGWLLKKAAPSARPTHVIVTGDERISVEVQSPLNTRKTALVLDGKTTATDDFFGNGVEYTARREGDAIVTSGVMTSPKLGKVPLETRRSVQDDGTMLYTISLTFPGEPPTVLKRVFKRK